MGVAEITLLSALLGAIPSGILAAIITLRFQTRSAIYQRKYDCLRRVVAHRSAPATPEFAAALNEIVVTFNGAPEVISAMITFQKPLIAGTGHDNDNLLQLIQAMMDDLGMDRRKISDSFFLSTIRGVAIQA